MKKLAMMILVASLLLMGLVSPLGAQMVTMDEALNLADSWITVIIQNKGTWGGEATAQVTDIQEFTRWNRVLGYFCRVRPQGYIVVSLRKELVPVKAYSATSDLNPDLDEGMADLIKSGIERVLNHIEGQLGPLHKVRTEELETIIDINYRRAWEALERGEVKIDYQEGDILLTSSWHQGDPYNQDCPAPPGGDDCTDPRCVVGCVATAGAQIMRYWNWPPYGVGSPYNDSYDWPNMPDRCLVGSPQVQIDAVAELSHEIGVAVGMDYCGGTSTPCASSAATADMEAVYENQYRYSTSCVLRNRSDYTSLEWYNRIRNQINVNRPVQYRVEGHSIVGDGWQEVGSPVLRQCHMNYGWDDAFSTWYSLDSLYLGNTATEYILENIYPAQALGHTISGTYVRASFPYRYFDRDCWGDDASFNSGQRLQFLPDIKVSGSSTTGGTIRIYGSPSYQTRLFTRGDQSRGVRIWDAGIKLHQYGGIKFF